MVVPTTAIFRMPFTEQLDLMRNALGAIHRRIPKVEGVLKHGGPRNTASSVRPAPGVLDKISHTHYQLLSAEGEAPDTTSKQGRNIPGPGVRPLTPVRKMSCSSKKLRRKSERLLCSS